MTEGPRTRCSVLTVFSRLVSKRTPAVVSLGALAAALGGGLLAHASGTESLAAVVLFGGLGLLVWVLLVIADGHRDPLWLSLAVSGIATMALFPSAFARLLCDDNYSCYAARGAGDSL